MTKQISGLAWHLHHDQLVEWCNDYDERVAYIKTSKPLSEQATRLRLFQMVKSPPAKLKPGPSAAAYNKARAVLDKARLARATRPAAYVKALSNYDKAAKVLDQEWINYKKTFFAARFELRDLHKVECPDCPWNGKTIFPEGAGP